MPGREVNAYVDRPAREAWQSAALLLCLSILDALLSLRLFRDDRFHELNPLLYIGLQHSDITFLVVKFSLTLFAIFVLLIHWNFVIASRQVRVVWLIRTMIVAYGLIVVYEVLLLMH